MIKPGLLWRTVRYLKPRQIFYQIINRLRCRPRLQFPQTVSTGYFLVVPDADKPVSLQDGMFTFLNQPVRFAQDIDWNYSANGKLWTYHLNYFDFLNQSGITRSVSLKLILDFIRQTDSLRDGLEPYPTSLRITNWIQFLSRHQIQDDTINTHLFAQTDLLSRRLEYHLMGNHLLENGFALLVSALYFRFERWYQTATKLVRSELATQILADGAHDERSPMYHQILLDQLLMLLIALQHDTWHQDEEIINFLDQTAIRMLNWLDSITFRNGDVPMVNDAAFSVAPSTAQLRAKAIRVFGSTTVPDGGYARTPESGYRMIRNGRYELFADVGPVGPDHQPGHAHADTFSFVLYVDNQPVIVDNGTSTYQPDWRRTWERSTAAHNTVEIWETNSTEVWSTFRVGRRARVTVLIDTETTLTARHDGYRPFGITHERSWLLTPTTLRLTDRLLDGKRALAMHQSAVVRFYFHPAVALHITENSVTAGPVHLSFGSETKLQLCVKSYDLADGFNQLRPGQCLEVRFTNHIETLFTLTV